MPNKSCTDGLSEDDDLLKLSDEIAGGYAEVGLVTDEQAEKTAEKVAELDDQEGLGPVRRIRGPRVFNVTRKRS